MNLDHIDHPLRLAKGSHQAGSGKGCAMNAISYISGDPEITDFPACGEVAATHIVALTRRAIRSWRDLAALANPSEAFPRQADQPGRAAADRARLSCPARRILADISQH